METIRMLNPAGNIAIKGLLPAGKNLKRVQPVSNRKIKKVWKMQDHFITELTETKLEITCRHCFASRVSDSKEKLEHFEDCKEELVFNHLPFGT